MIDTGVGVSRTNGVFDLSYLMHIPNFTVIAPTTVSEFEKALEFGINNSSGPVAIRIPKNECYETTKELQFVYGKWNEVKTGSKKLIIAAGSMLKEVMNIEHLLNEQGIYPTIVSAAFLKPFDEKYLLENISKYDEVFVLEENILKSGFGSSIIEFINDSSISKRVIRIGVPNRFMEHGKREELLEEMGLSGEKLAILS